MALLDMISGSGCRFLSVRLGTTAPGRQEVGFKRAEGIREARITAHHLPQEVSRVTAMEVTNFCECVGWGPKTSKLSLICGVVRGGHRIA